MCVYIEVVKADEIDTIIIETIPYLKKENLVKEGVVASNLSENYIFSLQSYTRYTVYTAMI